MRNYFAVNESCEENIHGGWVWMCDNENNQQGFLLSLLMMHFEQSNGFFSFDGWIFYKCWTAEQHLIFLDIILECHSRSMELCMKRYKSFKKWLN